MANIPRLENKVYHAVLAGRLQIDENGAIWRVYKRGRVRTEHRTASGHLQVTWQISGKRYAAAASRLVYLHFNGVIPPGLTINHKDGTPHNNHPSNLEAVTYAENNRHSRVVLGHTCSHWGEANPMAKLTNAKVEEIRRRRRSGEKLVAIAVSLRVGVSTVHNVISGRTWPES